MAYRNNGIFGKNQCPREIIKLFEMTHFQIERKYQETDVKEMTIIKPMKGYLIR